MPGATTTGGWGWAHQKLRAQWAPKVNAGVVTCWRCGQLIIPDSTKHGDGWDLGHDDQDRTRYRGPEHTNCNRAAFGRQPTDPDPRPWR